MVLIALPSLLVYFNAFHKAIAKVPIYSNTVLHGIQTLAQMPEFTLKTVLHGDFAQQYGTYFGQHFPLLADAVQIKGQLYWSILRQSPTWFIAIGQQGILYETNYLDEYCSRDRTAFMPVAESWAKKLMRIQRWYEAQGKVFLYVLTPSKAAIEKETIPANWPCRSPLADRENFHAEYRAILDRAGVNVVDAVETTEKAKQDYSFMPFPEGGTHFNLVSAARASQQMIAVMTRVGSWRRMDDFTFTWRMGEPDEVDTDLLDALNVPDPGIRYQTPTITIQPTKSPHCIPISMAQVGGSFIYQIDKVLQKTACPPNVDVYEYYKNTMAFFPGDRRHPVDPIRRAWALLEAAQVVVLEENEELAARSKHGEAFYDLVSRRIQAELKAQSRRGLNRSDVVQEGD